MRTSTINTSYRFILAGNGPVTNRGCEAIALGTRNILDSAFGKSHYLLASFAKDPQNRLPQNVTPLELNYDRPRWSRHWWTHQIRKVMRKQDPRNEVVEIIKPHLQSYDAMFSIGGDNYAIDYGYEIVDRLISINDCAKRVKIPVIIWGASIGPFDKSKSFEQRIAKHLSQFDLIAVREPETQLYLNSLGIESNVILAPDPAFAVEPRKPLIVDSKINDIISQRFIGLNLSPILSKYVTGGDVNEWLKLAKEIVLSLTEQRDVPIVLIPHVTSQTKDARMDDAIFLTSIYDQLPTHLQTSVVVAPNDLNCEELKWLISRADIFIGARTHSTIASFSTCVPCISIAYSRKAWGINKSIFGHHDWVEAAKGISASSLIMRVNKLYTEKNTVISQLKDNSALMKSQAFAAAHHIARVIRIDEK